MLEDWEKNHVYEKMIEHNADLPRFVLHDGPPYANGNIHMGTALNKIIKDIIIRDKNMEGYQAPYVPGFDTHGLPIELKALSSVGEKKKDISKLELRQICDRIAIVSGGRVAGILPADHSSEEFGMLMVSQVK